MTVTPDRLRWLLERLVDHAAHRSDCPAFSDPLTSCVCGIAAVCQEASTVAGAAYELELLAGELT